MVPPAEPQGRGSLRSSKAGEGGHSLSLLLSPDPAVAGSSEGLEESGAWSALHLPILSLGRGAE